MGYLGLHHIGLYVADMKRSLAFYKDGLGGKVVREFPTVDRECTIILVELAPGAVVELLPSGKGRTESSIPWAHIAIRSSDARSDYKRALSAGALSRHEPWQGYLGDKEVVNAFVTGPDGEVIEFFEDK